MRTSHAITRRLAGAALTAAAAMLMAPAFASATPTTATTANTTYYFDKTGSWVFYLSRYGGGCNPSTQQGGVKVPAEPANHNPNGPVNLLFKLQNCNTLKNLEGTLSVQGGSSAATVNIPTGKLVLEVPNMCYATNTEPISIPGTWTNGSVGSLQPSNFSAYGVSVPVKYTMCGGGVEPIKFEFLVLNIKNNPFAIPLIS